MTSVTAIGGTIAYANYDPQFKLTVDSYLPGFSTVTERSAVLWCKGEELAGESWKIVKKVVLPERSEKVGLQVNNESVKTETTPTTTSEATLPTATPTESATTAPTTTSVATTPTESTIAHTETTPTESVVATTTTTESEVGIITPTETIPTESVTTEATPEIPSEASVQPETTPPYETTPPLIEPSPTVVQLCDVFHEFTEASDVVVNSLSRLTQALNTHHLQVVEACKSIPQNEREMDILVGKCTTVL